MENTVRRGMEDESEEWLIVSSKWKGLCKTSYAKQEMAVKGMKSDERQGN